jgi:predicted DNA-binding protein
MTKKVSVQLSETLFERLEAATDRPGVTKSKVVEAALERFLDLEPPIEGVLYECMDRMSKQLERLAGEVQIISETVALHARYHLTINPPLDRSQQREACVLGDARFRALAEQVDHRVRLGRPLMRETIEGLSSTNCDGPVIDCESSAGAGDADARHLAATAKDATSDTSAVVREDGSSLYFRRLPNAFC